MDEKANNAVTKDTIPTEVEACADQNSNTTIMVKQEIAPSSSQEDETNLLSNSESIAVKLVSTKPSAPLMARHEMSAMSDGSYENHAFKEDVPRSASTCSGTDLSNGNILSTSDHGAVSEEIVSVGDNKIASKQGRENSSPDMKNMKDDSISQEKKTFNSFILGSPSDQEEGSSVINANDTSTNSTPTLIDDASLISSKSHSPRTIFRAARTYISNRLRSSSDSSSESRAERSRDWLFLSVITLVVSALDKLFDVLFLLTLLVEEEWVFLGVGLTFTVASTITTSLFAAQSFWLQSSQIPTWSSRWVQQIPDKKTVFLHEKFSKPINRRIIPASSRFAEPEIIYDTHDGASTGTSSGTSNSHVSVDETLRTNLRQESEENDGNNNSQGKFNEQNDNRDYLSSITNVHNSQAHNGGGESSAGGGTADDGVSGAGYHSVTIKGDSVSPPSFGMSRINEDAQETSRKVEDITEAPASSGQSTPPDSVDCGFEQPMKQQFLPWVRGLVIALFCTGLLPESVLVIHLVLYAKAGPKRRVISKMLRETWFVQTLKLGEALLESIPQIHLKMFYYLTRYREYDLSGLLDDDVEWFSSQFLGLLVNAASICIGLIAILHVHVKFKILAFIFLFINLATRIAICASLDFVTMAGVYFIPFGVAFVVSAASMVVISVLKCGYYRTGSRKLEKYIGVPVMRTFCKPPVDAPGVAVSAVFVAASIVCAHYISDGSLSLMAVVVVCGAFIGQVVPGLAWHASGITREHQENKRRTSIVRGNSNQNIEDAEEAGLHS